MAACAGMDPLLFVNCNDEVEMHFLRTIGARMIEIDRERSELQAKFIIRELSQALEKGNRRQQRSSTNSTK
jgi:hypothetical protein